MPFTPARHPGILHHFATRFFAFEHVPRANSSQTQTATQTAASPTPHHTLLFLGGLADDVTHPGFPSKLPPFLPQAWSVAELHIGSSGQGWTTSSLPRDADHVERAVRYFRSLPGRSAAAGGKIVLFGHSTGANVCMEYVLGRPGTGPSSSSSGSSSGGEQREARRAPLDGIILQGAASDRQGLRDELGGQKFDAALSFAKDWVAQGRGGDILPQELLGGVIGASPSASRFVSLADVGGGDDYFSSDLGGEVFARTFGRLDVPVLCLLSEQDEHMPAEVDKARLLSAWKDAVAAGGMAVWDEASGVVPGASHNYNKSDDGVVADMARRVAAYVGRVESGALRAPDKSSGRL